MGEKKYDTANMEFLSTKSIAKRMDKCTETIRREIYAGRLKVFRLNGDFVIRVEDFEEWKAKRVKPVE